MLFAPKYRDDIVRYYRGTYVKLKEFNDELFSIEEVTDNSIRGTHQDGEKFIIYMDNDSPYEVDYILPHKSFFQYGQHAHQLTRIPARQYFRGLSSQNTAVYYIEPTTGKLIAQRLTFDVLKAFVNKPAFPSLTAAMAMQDMVTVALSPRMMVNRLHGRLYVDFHKVARVYHAAGKDKRIQVRDALFWDEIASMLRERGDSKEWKMEMYVPPPPKEKTKPEDLVKELKKTDVQKKATVIFPAAGLLFEVDGGNADGNNW